MMEIEITSNPFGDLAQEKIFSESLFWVSQVLHVLCGLCAIGFGEMLPVQMHKKALNLLLKR